MRLLRIASVTFAFATVAAAQAPATQRPQNRVSLEQYLDWEDVQNTQLSPDGTQIIFTRRRRDAPTASPSRTISIGRTCRTRSCHQTASRSSSRAVGSTR